MGGDGGSEHRAPLGSRESPTRLLIADDENMTREAIAALLDMEPDIEIVGQAADGAAALVIAREHMPDVAFVDVEMPGGGEELVAALALASPATRACILTRHARARVLRRSLQAGAAGFVAKTASSRILADVVRRLAAGERYVDPALAADALAEPPCPLSDRELQILVRVDIGESTTTIAKRMHLASGTVRNYLSSALTKLGVRTRQEAVAIARDSGWL
ncbi:response regulator transcription factor [Nocardia sp. CA-290969]|uniref:response regulator transcription factor n=1 Tax=Nocardia sp. CA-290969 TaxID=3239986 RepID=UPI003D8BB5C0